MGLGLAVLAVNELRDLLTKHEVGLAEDGGEKLGDERPKVELPDGHHGTCLVRTTEVRRESAPRTKRAKIRRKGL